MDATPPAPAPMPRRPVGALRRTVRGAALLVSLAALAGGRPASAQLTVHVTALPARTPPGARVHVAGSFNGWNPAAPRDTLARRPDGTWALTLPDSVRGPVAFKLTLGAWASVETTADGRDVPNRTVVVPATGALTVTAAVAGWRDGRAEGAASPSTASPAVQVLADSFALPQLGRTRRVWIYLPRDYATGTRRYPVIYLHDGQNVFDAATSYAGEWGVDETLDSLARRGDPGAIVVAVDNGGEHRMSEYNPWPAREARLGGGEGGRYVAFLARTLKPWVDARYRTLPEARHTVVGGSSMGGLISLYAALAHPQVFGNALVFSPSVWIARDSLLALVRRTRPGPAPPRLYFVVGHEDPAGEVARDQGTVVRALVAAGWPAGRGVVARVAPDGRHQEWFWRREFPAAYRWLVAPQRPAPHRRAGPPRR